MAYYYEDEDLEPDDMLSHFSDDNELFEAWGCVLGEKCLMPGPHFSDECHTAQMVEQMMEDGLL